MLKAAVTGGAGFIGSNLCDRLLTDGCEVVAIDDLTTGRATNLASASARPGFELVTADIRSPDALRVLSRVRPEVVFHLAAQSGVQPSMRDPVFDAEVNVIGLIRVLEAAAAAGVRKVVFAGSGGTLYGAPTRFPVAERSRGRATPDSPYGISKKVAEDYLRFYHRSRAVDFTMLAMSNVFGPRQDPRGEAGVVAVFAERMLAGARPTINGDGEQTRDFVFVQDAVDAFARASGSRGSGRVINVSSGVETSVNRLAALVAEATGYEGSPEHGPAASGEVRRSALDPSLARRVLGWSATTPIAEGVRRTVEWVRSTR